MPINAREYLLSAKRGGWLNSNRGSAAVEMALVLPVLLIVFLAIVEFGNLMFTKLTLTNAAMMGARAGITARNDIEAEGRARAAIAESMSQDVADDATIDFPPGLPRRIEVDLSYSYDPILGDALFRLLGSVGPDRWDLSETAVMSFNN